MPRSIVLCGRIKAGIFIDTISDPTKITQVLRRNKDGSRAVVNCPVAVKSYNAGMGGVDLADAKRKVYSCSRKAKKWWPRLFYFVLDVCIVNAYVLQCETPHQPKISQKSFRLELARELLASHNSRKHRKRGRIYKFRWTTIYNFFRSTLS